MYQALFSLSSRANPVCWSRVMGPSGTFSQLLRTLVAAYFVGILDLGQLEMYRHYCRCVEAFTFHSTSLCWLISLNSLIRWSILNKYMVISTAYRVYSLHPNGILCYLTILLLIWQFSWFFPKMIEPSKKKKI